MFYSWQRHTGNDPNFALPMSSDNYHENYQHFIGRRPTTLSSFFGRPCTPGLNHSRTRNPLSLNDHLNHEASMLCDIDQKAFGSSRPSSSSSSKGLIDGNPIASTSAVPKRRALSRIPKEGQPLLRCVTSMSITPPSSIQEDFPSELKSRQSMNDIQNSDQQPKNRPYTTKSGFVWPFNKPGSLDSKITNQPPLKEQSGDSVPAAASKLRVVGRGGSGSRLRQVSFSNPAVLEPNVPCPRQPLESGFYRPVGRGGFGSLSTRPLRFRSPTAILGLLRGRKQSRLQLNVEWKPHEAFALGIHAHDFHSSRIPNDSFTISNGSRDYFDGMLSPSAASTLGEIDDDDDNSDSNSYIEEEIRPSPNAHRQRSLNKLARTLGELPPLLMEDTQSYNNSLTFDNSSTHDSRAPLSISTNLGDKFIGSKTSPHKSDSSTLTDDLHQLNLADDIQGELDNRSSFESDSHSPITFAPPSATTSPTGGHNPARWHSVSLSNDLTSDPNSLDTGSIGLIPLGTNEVISMTQSVPSKLKSWTGEWSEDLQEVIQGLRRL